MQFLFKAKLTPLRSTPCRFYQFSRLVKLSKSVVQSRPHVTIHSNPHIVHPCNHLFPIISPSLSLRVWILAAWLFAFVCHPAVTLSGSPATCAVLLFGLRVRLASVVIGYVFVLPALICVCDKPSPLPSIFFLGLKHILPAIPAITVTIIYASHRSKHVLPVSFALSLHITLPVLLLVVFPLFRSSDPHCNVFSFSLLFYYIYRALRMYCILVNHDVYTSALSAVATATAATAWAPIYISRR
jgi:hypothetical protein